MAYKLRYRHLDLHPGNIMINIDKETKLVDDVFIIDFGATRKLKNDLEIS